MTTTTKQQCACGRPDCYLSPNRPNHRLASNACRIRLHRQRKRLLSAIAAKLQNHDDILAFAALTAPALNDDELLTNLRNS